MIGKTVWRFDENRRVYRKGEHSGPIWREHWAPMEITGETSRSWIAGPNWNSHKIPKNGHNPRRWSFSEEEIDRESWRIENCHRIADAVRQCDYAPLRKIAELIGYKERA